MFEQFSLFQFQVCLSRQSIFRLIDTVQSGKYSNFIRVGRSKEFPDGVVFRCVSTGKGFQVYRTKRDQWETLKKTVADAAWSLHRPNFLQLGEQQRFNVNTLMYILNGCNQ